jgi:hypothetical protein
MGGEIGREKEDCMAEMVLMEKDGSRMNVPDAKVQEYLANGWIEISRYGVEAEVKQRTVATAVPKPIAGASGKATSVGKPKAQG